MPQDDNGALECFKKAAEQAHAQAISLMDNINRKRQHLEVERRKAALREAAERQETERQRREVERLEAEAERQRREEELKQLHQSADQGNAEAQYQLGLIYYYGRGIAKNQDLAIAWLHKAAGQGNEQAVALVVALAKVNGKRQPRRAKPSKKKKTILKTGLRGEELKEKANRREEYLRIAIGKAIGYK